jgi:hypothetical protein
MPIIDVKLTIITKIATDWALFQNGENGCLSEFKMLFSVFCSAISNDTYDINHKLIQKITSSAHEVVVEDNEYESVTIARETLKKIINGLTHESKLLRFFSFINSDIDYDIFGNLAFRFNPSSDFIETKKSILSLIPERVFFFVQSSSPNSRLHAYTDCSNLLLINRQGLRFGNKNQCAAKLLLLFLHELCHNIRIQLSAHQVICLSSPIVKMVKEVEGKQGDPCNIGRYFEAFVNVK